MSLSDNKVYRCQIHDGKEPGQGRKVIDLDVIKKGVHS